MPSPPFVFIILFGTSHLVLGNEVQDCPEGKFQPEVGAPCMDCSRCPDNQIVRETCWQQRDTVCGIFTEFQPFHQKNDLNILHGENAGNGLNSVSHKEAEDGSTGSWQTASIVMIVLLSVTTVICVVLIATVCYRCRRDKKDGLMIYVDKDSMESPRSGSSDAVSRCSASTDDIIKATPQQVQNRASTSSGDERSTSNVVEKRREKHPKSNHKVHQFEITEDNPNT